MVQLGRLEERPRAAEREEPRGIVGAAGDPTEVGLLRGLAGIALLLFAALLVLTEAFGRQFSKVGWETGSIYITEVAIGGVILLAIVGLGPRQFVARLRELPLIPLGVFWLAGVIALGRGVIDYGASQTLHDVGLVEYSIVIGVIALVVRTRPQADWLVRCLMLGGIVAIAFFAFASVFGASLPPLRWATIGSAATAIYIAWFACGFGAAVVTGARVPKWGWPLLWAGLVLIGLTYSRGAWIAAVVAFATLVAFAPRARRLRVLALGSAVLVTAGFAAIGTEKLQISGDLSQLRARAEALESSSLRLKDAAPASDGPSASAIPPADRRNVEIPQAIRETFANNVSESSNAKWRLAIWKYDLERAAHQPIVGVGFGTPTAFHWGAHLYDARLGNGLSEDVSGPHNSFVNIIFRMGLLGALALLALVVIAVRGAWPWLKATTTAPPEERATFVALVAVFVFISVVAAINVALEGPFMGLFFWTALGLLLVLPKLYGTPPRAALRSDPS